MADLPILAVHTFNSGIQWISQRDLAPPGSGTWSNPTKVYDGFQYPAFGKQNSEFSAGALQVGDSYGMVLATQAGGMAYLGNGLPAPPVSLPDPNNVGVDPYTTTRGSFTFNGAQFFIQVHSPGPGVNIEILKTTDGGTTWNELDSANEPSSNNTFTIAAAQRVDNRLIVCICTDNSLTELNVYEFDMQTETWGAAYANLSVAIDGFNNYSQWTNGIYAFKNGDIGLFYQRSVGFRQPGFLIYRLWTKLTTSWGAEVVVTPGESYANSVIDTDLERIHLWVYDTSFGTTNDPVHYGIMTHAGAYTSISTIPAPTGSSDGVGHSSLQSGMLLVPRDDFNDHDNAVWVALNNGLGNFFDERLPKPAQELGPTAITLGSSHGTGWNPGDFFTIANPSGADGDPAHGKVSTTDGSGHVTGVILDPGGPWDHAGAYTVANNYATTALSPATGIDLTVNVTAVDITASPSCAFMIASGYSLASAPVEIRFDLHGGASGLAAINPPSGPPGPIVNPTECVNQE